MNYFSVAAIFKNEGPYIGDWVRYHLGIGAEHLYLYDNDSSDMSAEIAKRVGGNRVTVEPIHGHPIQRTAYTRCIHKYRINTRWMAFLDIDEYLVPKVPIRELLPQYEKHACLCPHWVIFGSAGHDKYSPQPVPARFTLCQDGVDDHVKSIVDPKRTREWYTAHRFLHMDSVVDENENLISMHASRVENGTADKIYIAHYVTKSKEECFKRRSHPRPDTGASHYSGHITPEVFFNAHDRNERENLDVLNIWNSIKGDDYVF